MQQKLNILVILETPNKKIVELLSSMISNKST